MTGRAIAVRAAFGAYALCFSAGALMHARDFTERGWRPYAGAPYPLEAYWSVLIVLDAAAVALIATGRRRPAIVLAVASMTTDVAVNLSATAVSGLAFPLRSLWPVLAQTTFLGFVLGSAPFLWSACTPPTGR